MKQESNAKIKFNGYNCQIIYSWYYKCKLFDTNSITRENGKNTYLSTYLLSLRKTRHSICAVFIRKFKISLISNYTCSFSLPKFQQKHSTIQWIQTYHSLWTKILNLTVNFSYNCFPYLNILGNFLATLYFPTFIILQCLYKASKLANFKLARGKF